MKEFEKLLFEDMKRQECDKALLEVELGLFEQKEETTFDYTSYTKMSLKKYKRLYDLYKHNETGELAYVCPLIENNEGSVLIDSQTKTKDRPKLRILSLLKK